jgi:hypothetical protein
VSGRIHLGTDLYSISCVVEQPVDAMNFSHIHTNHEPLIPCFLSSSSLVFFRAKRTLSLCVEVSFLPVWFGSCLSLSLSCHATISCAPPCPGSSFVASHQKTKITFRCLPPPILFSFSNQPRFFLMMMMVVQCAIRLVEFLALVPFHHPIPILSLLA